MLLNRTIRSFYRVPLLVIAALAIASCGERPSEWAVVLWAPDETLLTTGGIAPIYGTSRLNSTYTVGIEDDETRYELEQWRFETFGKKRDALNFSEQFGRWADLYGQSKSDGLRVREEPDAESAQLYKLRMGEVVKIISMREEQVTVGTYEGYWYEVMTSGGVRGYTFDEFLTLKSSAELAMGETSSEKDEFLDMFFGSVYRPDRYLNMKRTGRYDLSAFLPDYGIFADAENRRIHIVTQDQDIEIAYDAITRPTEDSYAFEGSSLILKLHPGNWFNVIYADDQGVRYSRDFVYFPDDIELLTELELERRAGLLEELIASGAMLESTAYGTIIIAEDGSFTWSGLSRLVPAIVSEGDAGEGTVDFPLYLDKELASTYKGAVVFTFIRETGPEDVRFLYSFRNGGIRLTYIAASDLDENVVRPDAHLTTILFFIPTDPPEPTTEAPEVPDDVPAAESEPEAAS